MNIEQTHQKIIELMSLFVNQVKFAVKMGKTDINKSSENVLIPLLSEICDYNNLKNLNVTEGTNYPGIDLGDKKARVAFQVTSTPDLQKVKETVQKFIDCKYYEQYDQLIIYILTDKQKSYSQKEIDKIIAGNFKFDANKDIWDSKNLLQKIVGFQIEKAQKI